MRHIVSDEDTAIAMGSGDVPVLATPRLIAWLEAETLEGAAAHLREGETSVGNRIAVDHLKATPVGDAVDLEADPAVVTGRRLSFSVRALDGDGDLVAEGQITRMIVERSRFGA